MDRTKHPAPQVLCRFAAVVAASVFWVVLARLSGGNVLDPTSSAMFAPAALAVVLGITIGWDALTGSNREVLPVLLGFAPKS